MRAVSEAVYERDRDSLCLLDFQGLQPSSKAIVVEGPDLDAVYTDSSRGFDGLREE